MTDASLLLYEDRGAVHAIVLGRDHRYVALDFSTNLGTVRAWSN